MDNMSTQIDVEGEGSRAADAQGLALLPCPFCGSSAKLDDLDCSYFVMCTVCPAQQALQGPAATATAAWNSRAALQATRAAVEPAAWRYRYFDSDGWTYQQERPADPPRGNSHGKVIEPLYTTPPAAVIPAGFVLVPSRMYVDPESWEALPFIIGGPVTGPGEPYQSTTLWVGPIEQDDGSTIYGLHASSDECPEEGSVTIAEFAAPNPPPPINPAAIDSRSIGGGVAEHCEGDSPECGPVEHHDSEGVPLCKACWEGLLSDSTPQDASQ